SSRHYDVGGAPTGPVAHLIDSGGAFDIRAAADAAGHFTVVWATGRDTQGLRADVAGVPRGPVFHAGTYPGTHGVLPDVASDPSGNLIVTWSARHPGTTDDDIYAQRYGGLVPAALAVNDGNDQVLEVGDSFTLATAWRNVNGAAQSFQGRSSAVSA